MLPDMVLGVDGGGSKTDVWLARSETSGRHKVVGRGQSGPSNPQTGSVAAAIENVDLAITAAFDNAEIGRCSVASACIALAGAGRREEQEQIHQWADRAGVAKRILITNDVLPILYAANRDGIGIALVAGTGSLALGRNGSGETVRCGGWGPLLGDQGSGYDIARRGLRAAARAADHRGPSTRLLEFFFTHFQIGEASELIRAVYSDEMDRAKIASLAPLVIQAGRQGDAVAAEVVQRAVGELAESIRIVAKKLSFGGDDYVVALSGGLLLNEEGFRQQLCNRLLDGAHRPAKFSVVRHPVEGAVILATDPSAGSLSGYNDATGGR